MRITLKQLDYFAAVAEAGSITTAAESLHLSQSALSTSIKDLEKLLGLKLMVRQARGISLTSEGEQILRKARRLLQEAELLETSSDTLADELSGMLSIGCFTTICPALLPSTISDFSAKYPGVKLDCSEGSRRELVQRLINGVDDVTVVYDYEFMKHRDDFGDSIQLGSIPPHVLLPVGHPKTVATEVALLDLVHEPFILYDLEPADQYFLSLFTAEGLTPNIAHRSRNSEVVRGMVGRGAGYSLLTQRPSQTITHEGLNYVAKELAGSPAPLDIVALVPSKDKLTQRAAVFIEHAQRVLSTFPTY